MKYLMNAIPGTMLPGNGGTLKIEPVSAETVRNAFEAGEVTSAIGHADTAFLVGQMIGASVLENRINAPAYKPGDQHFLVLYRGPRLPEGSKRLPDGAKLELFRLTFEAL